MFLCINITANTNKKQSYFLAVINNCVFLNKYCFMFIAYTFTTTINAQPHLQYRPIIAHFCDVTVTCLHKWQKSSNHDWPLNQACSSYFLLAGCAEGLMWLKTDLLNQTAICCSSKPLGHSISFLLTTWTAIHPANIIQQAGTKHTNIKVF